MRNNLAVVGEALGAVADALEPFVRRVIGAILGADRDWTDILREKDVKAGYANPVYRPGDLVPLLRVLTERLGAHGYPFAETMPQIGGTYANELRSVRNSWAHLQPFSDADTYRALDTAERLLRTAGAFDAADRVGANREAVLDRLAKHKVAASTSSSAPETVPATDAEVVPPSPAEDHLGQVPVDSMATRIEEQDDRSESIDLEAALRDILASLDRPIPMAALSQRLIRNFGVEAVEAWGGRGGFAAFITSTEPAARLSGPLPGYVHPTGRPVPPGWDREDRESDVPDAIRSLRSADAELPLVTWDRMRDTIQFAISTAPPIALGTHALARSEVDRRSSLAIADAARDGRLIYRAHVAWVFKALQSEHASETEVTLQSAIAAVAVYLVSLAPRAEISPDVLHPDIKLWVAGGAEALRSTGES